MGRPIDANDPRRPVPVDDDAHSDPEIVDERLRLRGDVREALDTLPDVESEVVRLQHLDGLTHAEIAERLGVAPGTVKSRSHRAHRRLVQLLARLSTLNGPLTLNGGEHRSRPVE